MTRLLHSGLTAIPVAAAIAIAAWTMMVPISSGDSPNSEDLLQTIRDTETQTQLASETTSPLHRFATDSRSGPLRPDLRPPPPPEKKSPAVVRATPVKPVPKPPLRVNFTLVGTVIDADRSHAVLKSQRGIVMVVRVGESLTAPHADLTLTDVAVDSVTVSNGRQQAVIEVRTK